MLQALYHALAWTWGGDGQGGSNGTGYLITSGPLQFVAWLFALGAFYAHHRCEHCLMWGRFKTAEHHAPRCGTHRNHPPKEAEPWPVPN